MAIIIPSQDKKDKKLISIEDTRFIFATNFAGDPERDTFGSTARKANVIINDTRQVDELIEMGVNVRQTKPRPGFEEEFTPEYFVAIKVNYDTDWPPKIFLVSGDAEPVLLDEDSIGILDKCYVNNVNVVLNPYTNNRIGTTSLYVRTMYVEQSVEDDPFAARYIR